MARLRHLGLINSYKQINEVSEIITTDGEKCWTRQVALMFWWQVKSWEWSGSVAWDGVFEGFHRSGSGDFSGVIVPENGELYFPGLVKLDERDLLHRVDFNSDSGGTGTFTGDVGSVNCGMLINRVIEQYLNPVPFPSWITRQFKHSAVGVGFSIEDSIGNFISTVGTGTGTDGDWFFTDGSPSDGYIMRIDFGDDPAFVAGFAEMRPHTWYPYPLADGTEPVRDVLTGAVLRGPRQIDN